MSHLNIADCIDHGFGGQRSAWLSTLFDIGAIVGKLTDQLYVVMFIVCMFINSYGLANNMVKSPKEAYGTEQ